MNHPKKVANASYRDLDRISKLPEPTILHIQSFLPLKEAAQTCILSKTWKDICCLYPILYFDHNLFGLQFLLSQTSESGSVSDNSQVHEVIMDKFLDFVDNRLSRVNHENQPLRKLGLSISLAESDIGKYSSRIDHWMDLVSQAPCVEDLCFSVQITHEAWAAVRFSYILKLPILATKGLQFLSLWGCALEDCYSNHKMKISSSLRQLSLSNVILTEDAWDGLACCCPLIEIIELNDCYPYFQDVSLSKFSKSLKKASLCHNYSFERVVITGTNLESFKYDCEHACEMDVAACSRIRDLSIEGSTLYLLGNLNFFQDFTTIFPVLEEAYISADPTNGFGSKCLQVASHHHLRTLYLHVDYGLEKAYITDRPNLTSLTFDSDALKELYIDCSNLRHFSYLGSTVPIVLLFNASADMLNTEWAIHDMIGDMFMFEQLREFVKQISGYTINLYLPCLSVMSSFIPEEDPGEVEAFKGQYNINLLLNIPDKDMQNQASLLNWLLWSTCPSTLTVVGYCYDFVKHLCDKLSNKYEEDQGCNDEPFCSKHWWHHVKDFEVECPHVEIQDIKANLPELVEFHKTNRSKCTFTFYWYSYDTKALLCDQSLAS